MWQGTMVSIPYRYATNIVSLISSPPLEIVSIPYRYATNMKRKKGENFKMCGFNPL